MLFKLISGIMTICAFVLAALLIYKVINANKHREKLKSDFKSLLSQPSSPLKDKEIKCFMDKLSSYDNEQLAGVLYTVCNSPDSLSDNELTACKNYNMKDKLKKISKSCDINPGEKPKHK
jgi:hypothetical protein